jgi:hypothetical protein
MFCAACRFALPSASDTSAAEIIGISFLAIEVVKVGCVWDGGMTFA